MEEERERAPAAFVELHRIACGSSHTLTIDAEGRVWGVGSNFYGQLGIANDDYKFCVPLEVCDC